MRGIEKAVGIALGTVLATAPVAGLGAEPEGLEPAVRRFAAGGDQRDLKVLEAVLDPSFRVVFAMNDDPNAMVLSRAQYLDMIREGKIGGSERSVTIESQSRVGALGFVKVKMTRPGASFEGLITLVRSNGHWRVIEDATVMRTQAPK